MTQTIEQLTARVRELESQLAQANARISELEASPTMAAVRQMISDQAVKEASLLHERLAASQLSEKRLREALRNTYVELFHCDQQMTHTYDEDGEPMWHTGSTVAMALECAKGLLENQHDTSALDAYVAEKVKEALFAEATRGVPFNLPRDTTYTLGTVGEIVAIRRQRDLAVAALEFISKAPFMEQDAHTISVKEKAIQTLSAIKQSSK